MAGKQGLATRIPAGLEPEPSGSRRPNLVALNGRRGTVIQDPLDKITFGKPLRRHIMELMQLFALIALGVAVYFGLTHRPIVDVVGFTSAAGALLLAGRFTPRLLIPVWHAWMKVAWLLEVTTSYLIIGFMWFLMMVPMGFLLKLFGKKVMDLSFRAPVETYWETREERYHNFQLLERQY